MAKMISEGEDSKRFKFSIAYSSQDVDGAHIVKVTSVRPAQVALVNAFLANADGDRAESHRAPTNPAPLAPGQPMPDAATLARAPSLTVEPNDPIEAGLLRALGTTEDAGAEIRAYKAAGIINKKPNSRADYTDYHVVNKPAKFLGHEYR